MATSKNITAKRRLKYIERMIRNIPIRSCSACLLMKSRQFHHCIALVIALVAHRYFYWRVKIQLRIIILDSIFSAIWLLQPPPKNHPSEGTSLDKTIERGKWKPGYERGHIVRHNIQTVEMNDKVWALFAGWVWKDPVCLLSSRQCESIQHFQNGFKNALHGCA